MGRAATATSPATTFTSETLDALEREQAIDHEKLAPLEARFP